MGLTTAKWAKFADSTQTLLNKIVEKEWVYSEHGEGFGRH